MPAQERLIRDGWKSLAGGADAGRRPSEIGKNQYERGNNLVCRGGIGAEVRPPIRAHELNFSRRNMTYLANGQFSTVDGVPDQSVTNFHDETLQCASYFAPRGTKASIMAVVGGRLYQLTPKKSRGVDITEIELPYRNRKAIPLAFMYQADRFHITQDGESKPIIFDGVAARRATEGQIPVGTIGEYGQGRICQVVNGREIAFGDLFGSHDGREGKKVFTDPGESVLEFSETTYLNEGFNASIAFTLGPITGLRFAPQQDSAVGDGELLAFSENGISSFFLSQPREFWKDSAFQRITAEGSGGRSHDMIVTVNGDLWYRSDDGARTYRQARAEIQGWAHLPLSTEVRPWMMSDTPQLLKYGSAILFNNRLIMTCSPRTNQGRVYHKGLISLDFDVLSTFGQATKPAWDGHWDGLKFVRLVTGKFDGVNRAFAFAIDSQGRNQIYELMPEPGGEDSSGPISWQLDMRSMDFETPFNEKRIQGADLWVDNVTTEVVIYAKYKSDQEPDWQDWQTLNVIEPVGECQAVDCGGVPTIKKGYFPRRTLQTPPDSCNEQTRRMGRRCFEFQTQLYGTGHCVLNRYRLNAVMVDEDERANC
jgi:hypothetical protein